MLISTIGYGLIFNNLFLKNNNYFNISALGFLGLFFLYFISSVTHIFVAHNYIHNILVHSFGVIFFIFFRKKFYNDELKILFIFFIILFIGFFVSKNNEDFGYYHLPMSLQLVEQKLQFGLGNINIAYNHFSSLFHINSLFYLPVTKIYLFNLTNFLFQVFFFSGLMIILRKKKIPDFSKVLIGLVLSIYITKFNRLAEYGADYAGQLLVIFSIIIATIIFFNKDSKKDEKSLELFELCFYLMFFSITTKFMYSIYFLIPLFMGFKVFGISKFLLHFLNKKFLFITFFSLISLLFYNFSLSGCLIYPVSETCFFNSVSWTLNVELMKHMELHYSAWAKAGIGAGFALNDLENYVSNLNWLGNWTKEYFFNKVSDFVLLILFFFLLLFFLFRKNLNIKKIKKNQISDFIFFYSLIFIVFLVWFLNFPTLRYAGYSIVSLLFICPFCFYISNKITFTDKVIKKFSILFVILIVIFNVRNIDRINKEISLKENEHHNFKNFPFFWTNLSKFKTLENKFVVLNLIENGSCWATHSVCIHEDNLEIKKIKNFTIFSRK